MTPRRALVLGLVSALVALVALPTVVQAGNSPLGDTAAAWPSSWSPYLAADGTPYRDEDGDQSPGYADLSSGTASGLGSLPSLYVASNGSDIFFRMRIHSNPADAAHGGFESMVYQIGVYVGGVRQVVIGLNGKPASVDQVYIANDDGSTVLSIYESPFTGPSAGARALADGSGYFFVDFQVPIARVTQVDDDVTASALALLTISTATANNLVDPNKDAPPPDTGSTINLGPADLDLSKTKEHVSGPNPPEVGMTSVYDLTLIAENTGSNAMGGLVVSDSVPGDVSIVSTSTDDGSISSSGHDITWTVGSLSVGGTATATVRVSVTPTNADYGAPMTLNPGAEGAGTDAATGDAVTDGSADTATGDVAGDRTPTAADDTSATTAGGTVDVPVLDNDVDPDGPLPASGVMVTGPPSQGTASVLPNGTVRYTAGPSATGTDTFTYQACDGGSPDWCDAATVTVTIVNAPVANDDSDSVAEDGSVTTDVAANDADIDGDLDATTVSVTVASTHGSAVANGDGTVAYTPDPDFNGADSYGYQICDLTAVCDVASVSVTVSPVGDAPSAVADADSVAEDDSVTTDVAVNDADVDGDLDPSSVTVSSPPAHGSAAANGDGTVTYTPDPDYDGVDGYTYQICDDEGNCSTASVTVTVSPAGDAPTATDDSETVAEDGSVTTEVAANDADADGDLEPSSVTISSPPAHGSAVADGDGSVTYTPDVDWSGIDIYTYEICDLADLCDAASVTVTVSPVEDAPVAVDDADTVAEDDIVTTDVAANDGDVDGDLDPTSVSVTSPPDHGTATANGDGTVTYTPDVAYSGPDEYGYEICDVQGACDTATVSLVVGAVGDWPSAVDDAETVDEDGTVTTDVAANDSDIDGDLDLATVAITDPPGHGSAVPNGDGTVTYTPDDDFHGPDGYSYEICDAESLCAWADVTVTVLSVDDSPVAVDDDAPDTAAGSVGPIVVDVLANDLDPDDDLVPASVSIIAGASHGTTDVDATTGAVTYSPMADYAGADTFSYRVCDTTDLCDDALVTVTVAAAADPSTDPDDMPETDTEPGDASTTISVLLLVALATTAIFLFAVACDTRWYEDRS